MVSWGILSAAMVFVNSSTTFYVLRFMLGVAEAGFFPGIILYLTYWFPTTERGKCISRFMTAIPLSGLIGAPISGVLLNMHGAFDVAGWKWMFLLEALPSILMGFYVFLFLPDKPENCSWLSESEKALLANACPKNEETHKANGWDSFLHAIKSPQIWHICMIYFFQVSGLYGIGLWLPEILRRTSESISELNLGLISAVPFLMGTLSMVIWGWNSDRCKERKWHLV
ncbi:MAG: MFS transporter, partial [Planctomycetia bacterium]